MAQDTSTPNDSTEPEQEQEQEQEQGQQPAPDEGAEQQQVTTREDFAAYMARKRAEQNPKDIDPHALGPAGEEPIEDDQDEPEHEAEGEGESQGEGEGEKAGEGDETPPHKRQLGIDGDSEFKPSEKPPKAEQEDWFKDLPEEARQHIQQADRYANSIFQSYQALQGRVAPAQRLVEDLRKENEKLQRQLQNASSGNQPNPSLEDLDSSAAWKEVAEEFPDESAELRKLFSGKESTLQQANQQLQQLQEELAQAQTERTNAEWSRLKAHHPDADTVKQHPAFHQWVQRAVNDPQADPALVRKIRSPFYEDIADVFDAFKRDYFAEQPPQPTPAPAEAGGSTHQRQEGQAGNTEVPAQSVTPPPRQGHQPSRQTPPPPAPPSQGAGMSGAGRSAPVLSDREAFRQEMKRRKRLRQAR